MSREGRRMLNIIYFLFGVFPSIAFSLEFLHILARLAKTRMKEDEDRSAA